MAGAFGIFTLARDEREAPGTFDHAGQHVDLRVEIFRFLPQLIGIINISGIVLEQGQRAERVREFEWRSFGMRAVNLERFAEERFGFGGAFRVLVNIAEVAEGVGEFERVAAIAVDGGGFFVGAEGDFPVAQVAFAAGPESDGARGGSRIVGLFGEGHGGERVTTGVGEALFAAGLFGGGEEFFEGFGHRRQDSTGLDGECAITAAKGRRSASKGCIGARLRDAARKYAYLVF